jgi:dTDP-4-amino-4,6-dideoxygalactose transaminase
MRLFRSHGITRAPESFERSSDEGLPGAPSDAQGAASWYYEQQLLGYNYRITDILATLGLSQVERLDEYVERRNEIARRYDAELSSLPLQLPTVSDGNRSAFHLYVVRVKPEAGKSQRDVSDQLRQRGIGANLHYMPVHLQPYYRKLGFHRGQYPEAEAYGESAISIPMYPSMQPAAQAEVIGALRAILGNA